MQADNNHWLFHFTWKYSFYIYPKRTPGNTSCHCSLLAEPLSRSRICCNENKEINKYYIPLIKQKWGHYRKISDRGLHRAIARSIHQGRGLRFPSNRELKNHDDGLVDDDRKWVTLYCASATSKFRRRGVVDDAKQSRITSSCNPQASAGINPLFWAVFEGLCIFLSS